MGETTTPLVLFGRYTTLAGEETFLTLPVNVIAYGSVDLLVWRGPMPSSASLFFTLQESMDRETWRDLSSSFDPGAGTEVRASADLDGSWLRLKAEIQTGPDFPSATCYAVGHLVKRL